MGRITKIAGISINLFNPNRIAAISHGEVTNPHSYDISTLKPVKSGLFCPSIFGPEDYGRCQCGRTKMGKRAGTGTVCIHCGVEVGDPEVRKKRAGHITLVFPIVHIWFKSTIAALLGIPPRKLQNIIMCSDYIVLRKGKSNLEKGEIITFAEHLQHQDVQGFKAETGGVAVKYLLSHLDIDALIADLCEKLKEKNSSRRISAQIKVARKFQDSDQRPEWMVLEVLPVLPAGLRPVLLWKTALLLRRT